MLCLRRRCRLRRYRLMRHLLQMPLHHHQRHPALLRRFHRHYLATDLPKEYCQPQQGQQYPLRHHQSRRFHRH